MDKCIVSMKFLCKRNIWVTIASAIDNTTIKNNVFAISHDNDTVRNKINEKKLSRYILTQIYNQPCDGHSSIPLVRH